MHFNLVQSVLPLYFNRCFIRSFINIFVDIFYSFDYNVDLDINMNIIFINKIWVVKDNKTVIKIGFLSVDDTDYKSAVIISAIDWIAVVGHLDFICKKLCK